MSLLEAVAGDGPAAQAERLGYARMAARHGGADRVWRDAFNVSKGGSAYEQRNRNNPLYRYLSGWKGENTPAKVEKTTPHDVEKSNDAARDKAFLDCMDTALA